jgi:hypothetical protein
MSDWMYKKLTWMHTYKPATNEKNKELKQTACLLLYSEYNLNKYYQNFTSNRIMVHKISLSFHLYSSNIGS